MKQKKWDKKAWIAERELRRNSALLEEVAQRTTPVKSSREVRQENIAKQEADLTLNQLNAKFGV